MSLSDRSSKVARNAFTLVELLVVIAIIGVLLGMSIPAMQSMRELSRRSNCEQNLVRLSLALSAYSTRNGHYPIGSLASQGPIVNEPKGYHHNWISALLPSIDAANAYSAIDFDVSVYDSANDEVRSLRIPTLLCPSASDIRLNTTCYAGIHSSIETPIDEDNDGVFILNVPISDRDITDGLGYTLFLGEKLSAFDDDLGWMSGTRSTLRNTGHALNAERARVRGAHDPNLDVTADYVGGLASDHPGGLYVLLGSGQYQFRSSSMDQNVLQQLAARADGQLPAEWMTTDGAIGGPSADDNAATQGDDSDDADADDAVADDAGSQPSDDGDSVESDSKDDSEDTQANLTNDVDD